VQKGAAMKLVEQRVIDLLSEYAIDIAVSLSQQPEVKDDDAPYKKMLVANKTEEIAQLENQKSNLHDFLERGIYDVDTFMERQQNLVNRINGLQDEIRTLNDEIKKEEVRNSGTEILLPQLQTVIAEYWDADIETRNRMLKTVLEKATYLRKKEWTKPDQFVIQLYPKI
jgi:peptidoglycan hydrolase CwlO-like protein